MLDGMSDDIYGEKLTHKKWQRQGECVGISGGKQWRKTVNCILHACRVAICNYLVWLGRCYVHAILLLSNEKRLSRLDKCHCLGGGCTDWVNFNKTSYSNQACL